MRIFTHITVLELPFPRKISNIPPKPFPLRSDTLIRDLDLHTEVISMQLFNVLSTLALLGLATAAPIKGSAGNIGHNTASPHRDSLDAIPSANDGGDVGLQQFDLASHRLQAREPDAIHITYPTDQRELYEKLIPTGAKLDPTLLDLDRFQLLEAEAFCGKQKLRLAMSATTRDSGHDAAFEGCVYLKGLQLKGLTKDVWTVAK